MAKEKVLIVGGGFGGVKAAMELADDARFDVTLLTDHPNLRYYPTLYHNATGGSRSNSVIPFDDIFADKRLTVFIEKAVSIDRKAKKVIAANKQEFSYDTLIFGLGVVTNYFGINGLKEFSYGIKTNHDAEALEAHLHRQLREEHGPDLNYIIVGAGPTGIELAGVLPAYIRSILRRHGMAERKFNVTLVEALPRLLPRLPKDISRAVRRRLRKLGVKVLLGQTVEGQTADGLIVNGQSISSHTVIWTAGVTNNPFFSDNHFVIAGRGKVAVDTYLQTEPDIFVIGDNANTPYSGLAQTALYDGRFVARNLKRRQDGKDFKSYIAKKPITVIPAGPYWAAVVWGKLHLKGWIGWLLREAADFVAFRDYEAWPKATEQFLTERQVEEDCTICNTKARYENI
jgi:NADH:ubiquinone reductase (H+-translocating)